MMQVWFFRRDAVCDVFGNDLSRRRGSSDSADSEEGHRTDAQCNLPQLMSYTCSQGLAVFYLVGPVVDIRESFMPRLYCSLNSAYQIVMSFYSNKKSKSTMA